MGTGYLLRCCKCGYEFSANLGVGFMFPSLYQSVMESAGKGKIGKEVQRFVEEHPDGALDCDSVILQCTECGNLSCGPDLTMYVPGENTPPPSVGNWSVAIRHEGASYVVPWDLDKYELFGFYDHRCGKCKGKMRIIKAKELEGFLRGADFSDKPTKILCPECGEALWLGDFMMWD